MRTFIGLLSRPVAIAWSRPGVLVPSSGQTPCMSASHVVQKSGTIFPVLRTPAAARVANCALTTGRHLRIKMAAIEVVVRRALRSHGILGSFSEVCEDTEKLLC
eukprot:CAMPEP_0177561256 /NCGR_PEP_ID=MMETSP0369-20130122/71832_1 /TAXON_ID=447022 ORGANISM="Scrippsiella hangoei-like, Strain SHHI-4" /NCGR_SAMPLE_ID=MMETSP0369 /ASSEMBLY_ACC=CAM_ASM_000364 /LENGTH=103 /DNA_ID=CAMNT_0019048159 /DNA_START=49 /DNA_END=357 /DNA_ORIENTATION=+